MLGSAEISSQPHREAGHGMSLPRLLCPWGASASGWCTECPAASMPQAAMEKQPARGRRIPAPGSIPLLQLCRAGWCAVTSRLGSPCRCWQGEKLCSTQAVILSSLGKGPLLIPVPRTCSPGSGAKAPWLGVQDGDAHCLAWPAAPQSRAPPGGRGCLQRQR